MSLEDSVWATSVRLTGSFQVFEDENGQRKALRRPPSLEPRVNSREA